MTILYFFNRKTTDEKEGISLKRLHEEAENIEEANKKPKQEDDDSELTSDIK